MSILILFIMIRYFLWFILGMGFILYMGCNKGQECEQVIDDIDESQDLIAFVDPNKTSDGLGAMYINQEYKERIITEFGAIEQQNGIYYMPVEAIDGTLVDFRFRMVPVEKPYRFVTDDSPEEFVSKYKLFKNARCQEVKGAYIDTCEKIEDRYQIFEVLGWNKCKKGDDICLEVVRVVAIEKYYEDNKCTILVEIKDQITYSCTKK